MAANYCRISMQIDMLNEESSSQPPVGTWNTFNTLIHWLLFFYLTYIVLPPFTISQERHAIPHLPHLLLSL